MRDSQPLIGIILHRGLYVADTDEIGVDAVTWRDRELARERAAHDQVTGPDAAPELRQLAGQPDHRIQRVAEHGVAAPCRDGLAVDPNGGRDTVQFKLAQRNSIAEDDRLPLRIARHRDSDLRGQIATRLDDLKRWIDRV